MLKINDILYSSWGYEQTNICFYKVVGLSKTGKSVKLRALGQISLTDKNEEPLLPMSEYVIPNIYDEASTITTHRIKERNGRPIIKLSSYEYAIPWDGEAKFQSFWH